MPYPDLGCTEVGGAQIVSTFYPVGSRRGRGYQLPRWVHQGEEGTIPDRGYTEVGRTQIVSTSCPVGTRKGRGDPDGCTLGLGKPQIGTLDGRWGNWGRMVCRLTLPVIAQQTTADDVSILL